MNEVLSNAGAAVSRTYHRERGMPDTPPVVCDAQAVPCVQSNLNKLAENADAMHAAISDLEQRLGCVMRPPSPRACNAVASAEASHENVARRISDSSADVKRAFERVVEILSRLEI